MNLDRIKKEAALLLKIRQKPDFFIFNFVYTKDQHDSIHPIKKIPPYPYLRELIKAWHTHDRLLIPKSRQMLCTWTFIACHLWFAMYFRAKRIFLISKKGFDSSELLERADFIYDRLECSKPKRIRYKQPLDRMKFSEMESEIIAVAQDSEALHQYTASAIFIDEATRHEKLDQEFEAVKPTVEGGGKLTIVSTPKGKERFFRLVYDKE